MKIFFDNCLSPRIAKALGDLDDSVQVCHLREKFPPNVADLDWIASLGDEGGWTVITHDLIYRVPQQKEALRKGRVVAFFLTKGWAQLPHLEQARKLIGLWEKIKQVASRSKPGDFYRVPTSGSNLDRFRLE